MFDGDFNTNIYDKNIPLLEGPKNIIQRGSAPFRRAWAGIGAWGSRRQGPSKSPGVLILVDFGVVWGPFWEILLPFGRFGRPKGCSGGPRASGKGSGRGKVGPGSAQGWLGSRFWSQLGPNMAPTWVQKLMKKRSTNNPKNSHLLIGLRDPT